MRLFPRRPSPRAEGPRRLTIAELRAQARAGARRARRHVLLLLPLFVGVLVVYRWRMELFGLDYPVRIATAIALVIIAWGLARNLGQALQPRLVRLDPGTAGVVGWVVRLVMLSFAALVSLKFVGLKLSTLALGASFTAVVFGLAAQQTFGNIIAGVVLLSARPFGIGDRVRFQGFGFDVEGTIESHGLLYVTMTDGQDRILLPNNTALTQAVRPIREPSKVDMRARFPVEVDPEEVQQRLQDGVSVPTLGSPHVALEELDGHEVVMRVQATPANPARGGALAREVLECLVGLSEPRHADREPAGIA